MLEVALIVVFLVSMPDLVGQVFVVVEVGEERLTVLTPDSVLLCGRSTDLPILKPRKVFTQRS